MINVGDSPNDEGRYSAQVPGILTDSDFDNHRGVESAVFGDYPKRCVRSARLAPVRRPVTHRVGEHTRAVNREVEAVMSVPVKPKG